MSEAKPLFPDDGSIREYRCWNCGKLALGTVKGTSSEYLCSCGCGWSVRFNYDPQTEAMLRKQREKFYQGSVL